MVELCDTVNIIEVLSVHKKLYSDESVTGSNKMNLALRVKCPKLLSDFKEIWSFSTNFNKCLQYQISRSQADTCGQKDRQSDGYEEANRRCSGLYEKAK